MCMCVDLDLYSNWEFSSFNSPDSDYVMYILLSIYIINSVILFHFIYKTKSLDIDTKFLKYIDCTCY